MPRIGEKIVDLTRITVKEMTNMDNDGFRVLMENVIELQRTDRRENQILYYQPASERVRKVHHDTAKYCAISGGNGCLPLHAPVLMADGTWKSLGEIHKGDRVIGCDPVTGKSRPCNVTTVWRSHVTGA